MDQTHSGPSPPREFSRVHKSGGLHTTEESAQVFEGASRRLFHLYVSFVRIPTLNDRTIALKNNYLFRLLKTLSFLQPDRLTQRSRTSSSSYPPSSRV